MRILVPEAWDAHIAIRALADQGHVVEVLKLPTEPDLILHPAAHNWSDVMFQLDEKKDGTKHYPFVEAALAAARARKRGKKNQ